MMNEENGNEDASMGGDPTEDREEETRKINIDSSLIQSATLRDEDAELDGLGLRLYDQSALESGIRLQVDAALDRMEAQRQKVNAEKRARTLRNRISQLRQKCRHLQRSAVTAPRTYEELQRQKRQQSELADRRQELAELEAELAALEGAGSSQDVTGDDQSAAALLSGDGESELEAKVRLGEVTPFGTDLSAVTVEPASSSSRLIHSSAKSPPNVPGTSAMRGTSTETSPLQTKTSQSELAKSRPSASVNQSASAVRRPSVGDSQSEDEYVPSDESADESDEPYLPSDEEGGIEDRRNGKGRPVTKGTKRKRAHASPKVTAKRVHRETDDGDPEAYAARIREWRRERREERLLRIEQGIVDDDGGEERCVEFDGGFRCPASLWDRLFKYQQVCVRWLWELHQQRCGGILGDEMGLGKTIQVIAFLAGLSSSNVRWGGERGLGPVLVLAPATVLHQWVAELHRWWPPLRVAVLHESGSHAGSRTGLIRQMGSRRGVLLASYSAMTSHKEALVAQDWHYVILDEGHKIRNPDAQVTLAVKQVRTPHRVILSGSPLQNNLRELWSLFDFVFPGKLGTLPVFMSQFAVPITQGGYTNASDTQVVTAYRCAKVLRDTIAPYLLRRMKADVQQTLQLPTKNEQVLFCRLTDVQRQLYQDYLNSDGLRRIMQGNMKVFVGLTALRKLCNHPDLLTGGGERPGETGDEPAPFGHWRLAGKMVVLSTLLAMWRRQEHKVLLFTQSRQMLSIVEAFVAERGYSYLRMDGTTSVGSRQSLIGRFNAEPDIFCFLLTTRVGGLGVNLTGANRIVIYDPDWNPSTDQQARERAWRIGQGRHVTIYRLLTAGTIEEKIYHRQIFKQFLTNRVLKDPKQQRFFKTNDLHDLFTLTEDAPEDDGGSAAGSAGGRQRPVVSQTTETAEMFSGSQVNAAVLEARRQKEKKLRKEREKQKLLEAERRRRKLLEKARKLNRKLFTGGYAPQTSAKSTTQNRSGESEGGDGSSDAAGRIPATDGVNTGEIVESSQETCDGISEDAVRTTKGQPISVNNGDGLVTSKVTGKDDNEDIAGRARRDTDGASMEDGRIPTGLEAENPGVAVASLAAESKEDVLESERTGKATGPEIANVEEGELVEDEASSSPVSSSQDRAEDQSMLGTSSSTAAVAGSSSSRLVTTSFNSKLSRSPEYEPKKRKESHLDRTKRKERDERKRSRNGERREDSAKEERRRRRRQRRSDPLLGAVEGLVDSEVYRPPQTDDADPSDRSQDDYVLTKLFKKSGVHSAVRHDVIESHGTHDGAVLEAEAAKVAKEAVAALRASRREVRAAGIGTPTWTGQSGRAGIPTKPRFGQKKNPLLAAKPAPPPPPPPVKKPAAPSLPALFAPDTARRPARPAAAPTFAPTAAPNLFGGSAALGLGALSNAASADNAPLSSAQLLARIRRRADGEDGAEAVEVAQEHADLLADIRNFVAFQTNTNGRASTSELLGEFKARLPPEQSALFKALLTGICEFERGADKVGWWVLREELR
ncbi:DNA excision repair protein ERCC-6-like isoform X1 [Amphibalanus amphitrite]|nr:DNA excision repair protein ERCC-6-like isoform X1 [Amphibalanus amphitrite]XP_043228358.1 DNA excision repair protein ERCC-6-like isoform X1 [Amphibalanus amphitrite]